VPPGAEDAQSSSGSAHQLSGLCPDTDEQSFLSTSTEEAWLLKTKELLSSEAVWHQRFYGEH